MKKALHKDIIRTIWKEKKRFFSIMMITMLGVTMMTGLSAGCQDLRYSADRFFDSQELFDISVLSTLGLTQEDVEVFQSLDIIEKAEGTFSEIVHTKKGDVNKTAEVKVIKNEGLNLPYLVEGNLPQKGTEIAVTKNYMEDTGKQIGDIVTIEEIMDSDEEDLTENESDISQKKENGSTDNNGDSKETIDSDTEENEEDIEIDLEEEEEKPNFTNTTFQITGVVIDAMDINNAEGSAGFRATPNADYTFFITPDSVESEVYTAIYLSLDGAKELLCYSEEYEKKAGDVISMIEEEIMEQREQARYEQITQEAYDKINDAEQEMNEKFAEAEEEFADAAKKLADAEKELADAKKDIRDGWQELLDGKQEFAEKQQEAAQEFADAIVEIQDGYEKLKEGEEELRDGEKELEEGARQLQEGKQELIKQEESVREKLKQGEQQLNSKIQENAIAKKHLCLFIYFLAVGFFYIAVFFHQLVSRHFCALDIGQNVDKIGTLFVVHFLIA